MPLSAQLNYAGKNSVRSRSVVPSATATRSGDISSQIQHSWQTFVLLEENHPASTLPGNSPAYVRFDSPHVATPSPRTAPQWREDFGWHRSLHDSPPSHSAQSASGTATLNHLLAEVAHDIRTPIAVAQQIISLLEQGAHQAVRWTTEQSELLREAQLRLTQANRWAEGILLQHSLAHGQPVNVRRRFYPQQWLQSVQPLLNSLAKQRGVRLLWIGWDRSLPRLYADANQLSRVLLNLVDNALQASRPGNEVRVRVAWQTRVTQQMIVTIEDDGRGLSSDLMRQINTPHTPANRSHSQQTNSGVGLGLTTAKTLVHALGGTLRAQHPSGGGTQFSLTLPVDNYHSLVHSWLQKISDQTNRAADRTQQRIAIHALRSTPTATSQPMWDEIDLQLQQAASGGDLVYRVARDRWLWLSKQVCGDRPAVPPAMSAALRKLRERNNAWNLPLDCRHQQVFEWQTQAAQNVGYDDSRSHIAAHSCTMRLTSIIAERIAELIGDHVPPIDDLQATQTPLVTRPTAGGPARLIRSDGAHRNHPSHPAAVSPAKPAAVSSAKPAAVSAAKPAAVSAAKPFPGVNASIAETPCESFSGTLAELAQEWHSRQVRLDQIQTSVQPPRL